MNFIDLFAGIGGFRLGLEMQGHKCIGFCEKDKFAVKSYRAMFNTEGEWFSNDITKVVANDMPRAEMWVAGFPCQDISLAGRQQGINGFRSGLFFEIIRLVQETKEEDRPKLIFLENVKNILSINSGIDFTEILYSLHQIGYDAEWQLINSSEFVPQNRERVYIVGHLRGERRGKIFPTTGNSQQADFKEIDIIGTTKNSIAKGTNSRSWVHNIEGISSCLTSTDYKQAKQIMIKGDLDIKGNDNLRRIYLDEGISPSLTGMSGGGTHPKIIVKACLTPNRIEKRQNGRRFKEDGEHMFTLTQQDIHGVLKDNRIRRLTPKECFRLQSFPDEYFEKARKVNSDCQLYKQAGNSVTVNVISEIAKRIGEVYGNN